MRKIKSKKREKVNGVPDWRFVKNRIKPLYEYAGIFSCELRDRKYKDSQGILICSGNFNPTFAHSRKRIHIRTPSQMEEVIMACQACHKYIEDMGEAAMYPIVIDTINNRRIQVRRLFKR